MSSITLVFQKTLSPTVVHNLFPKCERVSSSSSVSQAPVSLSSPTIKCATSGPSATTTIWTQIHHLGRVCTELPTSTKHRSDSVSNQCCSRGLGNHPTYLLWITGSRKARESGTQLTSICREPFATKRAIGMSGGPQLHHINLDQSYGSPPRTYSYVLSARVPDSSASSRSKVR